MKHNSAAQRHFYAQVGFEALLESYKQERPNELYIIGYTDYRDRYRDKLKHLYRQLALGFFQLMGKPHIIEQKAFRRLDEIINVHSIHKLQVPKVHINITNLPQEHPWSLEQVFHGQEGDKGISELRALLTTGQCNHADLPPVNTDQFSVVNQIVYHDSVEGKSTIHQIYVPEAMRQEALRFTHIELSLHGGKAKSLHFLRRCFFWPQMYSDLLLYIRNCLICQQAKSGGNIKTEGGKLYTPYLPMDCLCIDLLGIGRQAKGGYKYILTAVDMVTRYAWAIPVKSRMADELAEALIVNIFSTFGSPKFLLTDQAAEFKSALFQEMLAELQIRHHLISIFSPTSNAVAERTNQTFLQLLRTLLLEYEVEWNMLLPSITSYHNAGKHTTLGDSPFYLMFLRESRIPYESILPKEPHDDPNLQNRSEMKARCLEIAREAIVNSQDRRLGGLSATVKASIDIGDIVYILSHTVARKDHKILPKWYGPHRVLDLKGMTAVIKAIKNGKVRQVSMRQVKLVHHSGITKTENKNVDEVYPLSDDNHDFPAHLPHKDISRHEDAQNVEGDDVLWLPGIGEDEVQGKIDINAGKGDELKVEFSPSTTSESYASKLKRNVGGKGRKPLQELPLDNEAVASRTRSRGKKN